MCRQNMLLLRTSNRHKWDVIHPTRGTRAVSLPSIENALTKLLAGTFCRRVLRLEEKKVRNTAVGAALREKMRNDCLHFAAIFDSTFTIRIRIRSDWGIVSCRSPNADVSEKCETQNDHCERIYSHTIDCSSNNLNVYVCRVSHFKCQIHFLLACVKVPLCQGFGAR